jgi:hypothetical protein
VLRSRARKSNLLRLKAGALPQRTRRNRNTKHQSQGKRRNVLGGDMKLRAQKTSSKAAKLRKAVLILLGVVVAVCLAMPGQVSQAYTYLACDSGSDPITWSEECDDCARMHVNTISFPAGNPFTTEVNAAMDTWNAIERSNFTFVKLLDTNGTYGENDVNEVVFDDIDGEGDTLAVTRTWYNLCYPFDDADIKEADVIFDVAEDWYTSAFNYTSSNIHFRTVAVHEFGHALGLKHEDDVLETMNSFYPNGGPASYSKLSIPLADSRQGLRFLYPQGGTAKADLVALNFKRTGAGSSALVSGPTSAPNGSYVTIQCTFQNIGSASSGEFNIGFYLSTNDFITTSDRLLGTNYGAWASAGATVTFTRTLYIPADVAPGVYRLGLLLDKDGDVDEWNNSASNNGLAQPRTITIY